MSVKVFLLNIHAATWALYRTIFDNDGTSWVVFVLIKGENFLAVHHGIFLTI